MTADADVPAGDGGDGRDGRVQGDSGSCDDAEAVAELLHAVGRALRQASQQELGPLGLTLAQLRVLRLLRAEEAPLRMGELARRLGVVPRSATSLVDALEAGGFLARHDDAADRRATLVSLTAAGAEVLAAVRRRRSATAGDLLGRLSPADRATLRRLLGELAGPAAAELGGGGPQVGGAKPASSHA